MSLMKRYSLRCIDTRTLWRRHFGRRGGGRVDRALRARQLSVGRTSHLRRRRPRLWLKHLPLYPVCRPHWHCIPRASPALLRRASDLGHVAGKAPSEAANTAWLKLSGKCYDQRRSSRLREPRQTILGWGPMSRVWPRHLWRGLVVLHGRTVLICIKTRLKAQIQIAWVARTQRLGLWD